MRWSWRDSLATLFIVAAVVPYVGYLLRGEVPFIESVPAMAGAGIVLGLFAFVAGADPTTYGTRWHLPLLSLAGLVALALGLAAYNTENSGVLAAFFAWLVGMWLVTTVHHLRARTRHLDRNGASPRAARHAAAPPPRTIPHLGGHRRRAHGGIA